MQLSDLTQASELQFKLVQLELALKAIEKNGGVPCLFVRKRTRMIGLDTEPYQVSNVPLPEHLVVAVLNSEIDVVWEQLNKLGVERPKEET